jgi:tetratricopeptide (TPR) repeat protein
MELDTGSPSLVLYDAGARRLNLKFARVSEPAKVTVGGETFTAPLPIFDLPWYYRLPGASCGVDGLVGWPEIRDNILVFDAGRRTIRRIEQLPPETAGWLKLKTVPDRWLLLEAPLADGKTAAILVDTGDPSGFGMMPTQWQEWKAAHPEALLTSHKGDTASFGAYKFQVAWADEIKLGALTLTDLPVENMPPGEATFLQKETPAAKTVWSLGMYALMRMDFIVDWKSGFAYLHPKPPPGPPYPGVKRPGVKNDSEKGRDWTVAQNVRLSSDNLFVTSGEIKWGKNDFEGALADYTQALELNPNNADACTDRGDARSFLGNQDGAIADYNHALEFNPNNADAYSGRGGARELQGDFSEALSDYDKGIELKPDDSVYERLFRQTLLLRLGRPPGDFSKTVAAWKGGWTKSIGLFLAGKLDEKALLAAAKKSDAEPVAGQNCEAYYYIGMMRLSKGDKAGAREAFQKCRAVVLKDYSEYQFAGAELGRP